MMVSSFAYSLEYRHGTLNLKFNPDCTVNIEKDTLFLDYSSDWGRVDTRILQCAWNLTEIGNHTTITGTTMTRPYIYQVYESNHFDDIKITFGMREILMPMPNLSISMNFKSRSILQFADIIQFPRWYVDYSDITRDFDTSGDLITDGIKIQITKEGGLLDIFGQVELDPIISDYNNPSNAYAVNWARPNNIFTSNNQRTTSSDTTSNYLFANHWIGNFSFYDYLNIGEQIIGHGLECGLEGNAGLECDGETIPRTTIDFYIYLGYLGLSSTSYQRTYSCATDYYQYVGGSTSMWGYSQSDWTRENIEDGFLVVQINQTSTADGGTANFDHLKCRLYYDIDYSNPPEIKVQYLQNDTYINYTNVTLYFAHRDTGNNTIHTDIYFGKDLGRINETSIYRKTGNFTPIYANYSIFLNQTPYFNDLEDNNIWGVYHLDGLEIWGESDNDVHDFSGNNRDGGGSISDAHYIDNGKYGGCMYLDGDEDYISFGNNYNNLSGNFTLMAWVNTSESSTGAFFSRWDAITNEYDKFFRWLLIGSQNNITFDITPDGNISNTCNKQPFGVVGGLNSIVPYNVSVNHDWHHHAIVWDDSGQTATQYIDGINIGSIFCGFSINKTMWADNAFLRFGVMDETLTFDLIGSVDELLIFNRSLTPLEILNFTHAISNDRYYWQGVSYDNATNHKGESEIWEFEINYTMVDLDCIYDCLTDTITSDTDCEGEDFQVSNQGTLEVGYNVINIDKITGSGCKIAIKDGHSFISD